MAKLLASILSALAVGAIGWNFSTVVEHGNRLDKQWEHVMMLDYLLKYHGIPVPEPK